MGFLDLFRRKKSPREIEFEETEKLDNWSDIVYNRGDVNLDDPGERREYIGNCLQQIADAEREMDALQAEYRVVTSHLRDMEEIDALPREERNALNRLAMRVQDNEARRREYRRRESNITEDEYERVERLGVEDIRRAATTLAEAQEYLGKVKNDLRRLSQEHQAYLYRREELDMSVENAHRFTIVASVMLAVVLVALFVVGKLLELNVIIAYLPVILVAVVLLVMLRQRETEAVKEKKGINRAITRLIQLENRVKIRYVNTKNLVDYECLKYRVKNASELTDLCERYDAEREERRRMAEAVREMDAGDRDLVNQLRKLRIRDPEIWTRQVAALLDHNEEVELRHELISQRQSLRSRMDYNQQVIAGNARSEIDDIVARYPAYAQEILDMVDSYERRYDREK